MLAIFIAVLIFAAAVYVHEAGHYAVARLLRVEVEELALGFGPKLFGWTSRTTGIRYSLRLLPLGGYTELMGEDALVGRHASPLSAFEHQPVWKRLCVVAAGPAANLLFAAGLCMIPAIGDALVVPAFAESASVQPPGMLGEAWRLLCSTVQEIIADPGMLVRNMTGPVELIQLMSGFITGGGLDDVLWMGTCLSIGMAVGNLLPIPGLDGGRLVLLAIEGVRRRKLSPAWENCMALAGILAIGGSFIVAIVKDVLHIFG